MCSVALQSFLHCHQIDRMFYPDSLFFSSWSMSLYWYIAPLYTELPKIHTVKPIIKCIYIKCTVDSNSIAWLISLGNPSKRNPFAVGCSWMCSLMLVYNLNIKSLFCNGDVLLKLIYLKIKNKKLINFFLETVSWLCQLQYPMAPVAHMQ